MKNKQKYIDFSPSYAWLKQDRICWLAFGFGAGLAKKAPGTVGTLVALPIAAILLYFLSPLFFYLFCLILFLSGIYICNHTENKLAIKDYGGIVWDEIVAMLIVLGITPQTWQWWLVAFLLFRLFDALKPWPISWFDEHIHGGLGIMLDDLIAALMVMIIIGVAIFIMPMVK